MGVAVESTVQKWLQDLASGELLARQLTTVRTVHVGFVEGFTENPMATLMVLAGILFLLSVFCRLSLFALIRLSGHDKYDNRSRALENAWLMVTFAIGWVAGEVCFRNLWLSVLTGAAFAVISVGAVLEATVANEASRRRARRSLRT